MLKELVIAFTSPLNHSILIIIISLLVSAHYPAFKRFSRAIIAVTTLWLFLCSQFYFSYFLVAPLERHSKPILVEYAIEKENSAIFVLGSYYIDAPDKPWARRFNDSGIQRLTHAYLLYKSVPQPIIVTGGNFIEYSDKVFAEQAREYLIRLGVPDTDIIVIGTGSTTKSEVEGLISKRLKFQHYNIVSSATHMPRISKLFSHYGFADFTRHPIDHLNIDKNRLMINFPNLDSLRKSESAIYEYLALIKTNVMLALDDKGRNENE